MGRHTDSGQAHGTLGSPQAELTSNEYDQKVNELLITLQADESNATTVVDVTTKHTSVPTKGKPNSVTVVKKDGKIIQKRHYDENGNVDLDIDYTNHGNSKTHPVVPHKHRWHKGEDGNLIRGSWEEI